MLAGTWALQRAGGTFLVPASTQPQKEENNNDVVKDAIKPCGTSPNTFSPHLIIKHEIVESTEWWCASWEIEFGYVTPLMQNKCTRHSAETECHDNTRTNDLRQLGPHDNVCSVGTWHGFVACAFGAMALNRRPGCPYLKLLHVLAPTVTVLM
ncbi:hypothetical protein BFJ63_vAg16393 [Fusarium oxysporum f. sp. narcissi]|uniref:Uncharacterized protein n=1 Tax=Fusarium oxysporum f. sp. narcissi TaxID=451672 RepID=A0A4Q2V7K6_FUSOX|nr:hypothetical protein BFJ63_vAg16393 [Fusarium oxysporum f. sp. narcissi]